jgi:hypothetical protein
MNETSPYDYSPIAWNAHSCRDGPGRARSPGPGYMAVGAGVNTVKQLDIEVPSE